MRTNRAQKGPMIYVLKTKNSTPSFVKVGYTKRDIEKRIRAIQTGCPIELELLLLTQGDFRHERGILNSLKEYRTIGEWFQDRPEVHEIIKQRFSSYKAKPLNIEKIMLGKMTDTQKRVNRAFREEHSFAYLLKNYCEQRKYKEEDIIKLAPDKRTYVLEKLVWQDVSEKYDFLGPEFDGLQTIIVGRLNRGEDAKRMLLWFKENSLDSVKDIEWYENSLKIFKNWQRRNRDFTTVV